MTVRHMTGAAALAVSALLLTPAFAESTGKSKLKYEKVYTIRDEAARTLKNIEEQAYTLNDHAFTVQAATSLKSAEHDFLVTQMNAIKDDINSIGKEVARLESLAPYESSPERRAVTRAKPQLEAIAASANANLRFLNDHPSQLDFGAYRDLSVTLSKQTETFWRTMHDSVTLANLAKRQERLRKDLVSPSAR